MPNTAPPRVGGSSPETKRGVAAPAIAIGDAWAIVEHAPDAVLVVDEHGTIELANRAAVEMFGYDRETLAGLNVDALVPQDRRQIHRTHRAAYAAAPRTRPMGLGLDLRARRADRSEFRVEISLSPVTFGQGSRVIVILRELTGHRAGEQTAREEELILAEDERIGVLLRDTVISRLLGAGLALQAAASQATPEVAERLAEIMHGLDLTVTKVRQAVLPHRESGKSPSGGA